MSLVMSPVVDILLVEDDWELRDVMLEVLNEKGYRTIGAANGREALDWLEKAERLPKVILLDMRMSVMDGWEFRKLQVAHSSFASIPVATLSATPDLSMKNMVAHLKKPIHLPELLAFAALHCG